KEQTTLYSTISNAMSYACISASPMDRISGKTSETDITISMGIQRVNTIHLGTSNVAATVNNMLKATVPQIRPYGGKTPAALIQNASVYWRLLLYRLAVKWSIPPIKIGHILRCLTPMQGVSLLPM